MVCLEPEEESALCLVRNTIPDAAQHKIILTVRPSYTVGRLISDVQTQFQIDKFELIFKGVGDVLLNDKLDQNLKDVGVKFGTDKRQIFNLRLDSGPPENNKLSLTKSSSRILKKSDSAAKVIIEKADAKEVKPKKKLSTISSTKSVTTTTETSSEENKKIVKRTITKSTKTIKVKTESKSETESDKVEAKLENGIDDEIYTNGHDSVIDLKTDLVSSVDSTIDKVSVEKLEKETPPIQNGEINITENDTNSEIKSKSLKVTTKSSPDSKIKVKKIKKVEDKGSGNKSNELIDEPILLTNGSILSDELKVPRIKSPEKKALLGKISKTVSPKLEDIKIEPEIEIKSTLDNGITDNVGDKTVIAEDTELSKLTKSKSPEKKTVLKIKKIGTKFEEVKIDAAETNRKLENGVTDSKTNNLYTEKIDTKLESPELTKSKSPEKKTGLRVKKLIPKVNATKVDIEELKNIGENVTENIVKAVDTSVQAENSDIKPESAELKKCKSPEKRIALKIKKLIPKPEEPSNQRRASIKEEVNVIAEATAIADIEKEAKKLIPKPEESSNERRASLKEEVNVIAKGTAKADIEQEAKKLIPKLEEPTNQRRASLKEEVNVIAKATAKADIEKESSPSLSESDATQVTLKLPTAKKSLSPTKSSSKTSVTTKIVRKKKEASPIKLIETSVSPSEQIPNDQILPNQIIPGDQVPSIVETVDKKASETIIVKSPEISDNISLDNILVGKASALKYDEDCSTEVTKDKINVENSIKINEIVENNLSVPIADEPNVEMKSDIITNDKVQREQPDECHSTHVQADLVLALSSADYRRTDPVVAPPTSPISFKSSFSPSTSARSPNYASARNYVGLVNQAMTCYLNSLIQALYMTPEFRNALYNWSFDDDVNEQKSIPYQLQKLFLNLQTSTRNAVETTDLTRSFGWTSSDAWQQHDIQELCRVMFDALEQKFKNTRQSDLINRLYEGKMIDYVKCLECNTEKSREDTFLDIPLPVRPFGSTVAYGSIEEAISAFVQPETLDGNNQYNCEKCNKKCDAHKGLKFKKFPYILTLHLKRFDFDYQTFHRIKLNDKVTFPQKLDLNDYLKEPSDISVPNHLYTNNNNNNNGDMENVVKYEDCSTTDSGSAMEEDTSYNGTGTTASSTTNDADFQQDVDEGIDMTTTTSEASNRYSDMNGFAAGPHVYELFAIMIHSGSASGGHYYAYIKEFDNGEWYCFNDQSVSSITEEDIEKTFGGSSIKAYYSSAYSSSTNAYMLMYRQIDKELNVRSMKCDEFPDHIKHLLHIMKHKYDDDQRIANDSNDSLKLQIYHVNGTTNNVDQTNVLVPRYYTIHEATVFAYTQLRGRKMAPVDQCRLVLWNSDRMTIQQSFNKTDIRSIGDIVDAVDSMKFFMETREFDEEFPTYKSGGFMTKVYCVDLNVNEIYDGPFEIYTTPNDMDEFKIALAKKLDWSVSDIVLDSDYFEPLWQSNKVFVTKLNNASNKKVLETKLHSLNDKLKDLMTLIFSVPNTDRETLDKLEIPNYEPPPPPTIMLHNSPSNEKKYAIDTDTVDAAVIRSVTPQPSITTQPMPIIYPGRTTGDSEDSSQSDGDRTLVESVHDDISSTCNSPALSDRQVPSPDPYGPMNSCDYLYDEMESHSYYISQPIPYVPLSTSTYISDSSNLYKIFVDNNMTLGQLKRTLEPYIKVPKEYFKVFKHVSKTPEECQDTDEELCKLFRDNSRFSIEFGRVLQQGEYRISIYFLDLETHNEESEELPFLCEWIVASDDNIGEVKRKIIQHLLKLDNKKYEKLTYDNCRLRRKVTRGPGYVYVDHKRFNDNFGLRPDMELVLQLIDTKRSEPKSDEDDTVMFMRQWHPESRELGQMLEICVGVDEVDLYKKISNISGIPKENIEHYYKRGQFPHFDISLGNLHSTGLWTSDNNNPHRFSTDSPIIVFRDKTVQLKKLTVEQERDITNLDTKRLERSSPSGTAKSSCSSASNYSPRRERALKIFLDNSPK